MKYGDLQKTQIDIFWAKAITYPYFFKLHESRVISYFLNAVIEDMCRLYILILQLNRIFYTRTSNLWSCNIKIIYKDKINTLVFYLYIL